MGAFGYTLAQADRQKPNAHLKFGEQLERDHPRLVTVGIAQGFDIFDPRLPDFEAVPESGESMKIDVADTQGIG